VGGGQMMENNYRRRKKKEGREGSSRAVAVGVRGVRKGLATSCKGLGSAIEGCVRALLVSLTLSFAQ
jgi:hypothetical protein